VSPAPLDLSGRVVLITGAARGIGLASAHSLARRGARLALIDVDAEELERQAGRLGTDVAWTTADVTDLAAVEAAVADLAERQGSIDVVLANAGIEPPAATARSIEPDAFRRVLDVNLHGVWHTAKATLPHVIERRGHLLLVASLYAFMNGTLAAPYAVSKAGVEALGRALRTELGPHGATAGVAYFGFIQTDLVTRAFAAPAIELLRRALPSFVTEPIPVERASDAIVKSIEARSARATAPWWVPLALAAEGLMPPLDERLRRDPRIHAAIRSAEGEPPGRASPA
jgi:NAD(P)-dependent dehydrogenase (short-subunit alcohol dehydrogenase family)